MGDRFMENKFKVFNNPFGTAYNPISIFKLIDASLTGKTPNKSGSIERDGTWFHHDYHSSIWASTEDQLMAQISDRVLESKEFLSSTKWLIITFGTAKVYERDGKIVNNCHKVPQNEFHSRLLSANEISGSFTKLNEQLTSIIPDLNILLTVSPVRHIKDTVPVNNLSKSILRVAVDNITNQHSNTQYFPSFEIMIDDLRDYRFYKDDLIHPTAFGEEYIWEKLTKAFLSEDSMGFLGDWQKIKQGLHHKPFQPGGAQHQKFLKNLLKKLENLSDRVNVVNEIESVKRQIL